MTLGQLKRLLDELAAAEFELRGEQNAYSFEGTPESFSAFEKALARRKALADKELPL